MYRVKEQYSKKLMLITLVNGIPFNLLGTKVKKIIPATYKNVRKEIIIEGATQKELEIAYKENNSCIEFID